MKKIVFLCLCMALCASCVEKSKYEELKQENELLKIEKEKSSRELNDMLSTLNEVEESLQSMNESEEYLNIRQSGEITPTVREQIKNNVLLIAKTLKSNREQLAKLEEKMKKSDIRSAELQKTISRLNAEIDRKAGTIASLQEELMKKDIRIRELDETVAALADNLQTLSQTTASQSEQLRAQEKELNRAYYCYGTRRELKEQNILTGGGLFSKPKALQSTFNRDYFIAIDKREVTEIPLFDGKASVRTNHPEGSYELVKDGEGNLTLRILDIAQFWSFSEYLVIEVG
jgi:alanyl-tRNA synthetase